MGTLSSQTSSERGEWRRQDAGGWGRAQEGAGSEAQPGVLHPPSFSSRGICPSSWAHNPLGRCHYSSPPGTQQLLRNGSFTLMPNPRVLATLSLAASNPLFSFRCLYLLLLVTTISRMTATPPTPGSASLVFTRPQLPFKGQPVCIPFRRTTPGPLHMLFPLLGAMSPPSTCPTDTPPQVLLRLHRWEAVLDALSGWGAGCVWVPCRVSPRIPCCDCQVQCSGSVSSMGPGTQ